MSFDEILGILSKILNYTIFELNQTPVSISSILMFIFFMLIFYFSSRFITKVILNNLFSRLKIEEGTSYTMKRVIHYVVMIIGAIVAFQFIGIDLSGLAVIFGLLSVGWGRIRTWFFT